jgi:hypothetical protein
MTQKPRIDFSIASLARRFCPQPRYIDMVATRSGLAQ